MENLVSYSQIQGILLFHGKKVIAFIFPFQEALRALSAVDQDPG
jgi:hypothetical protein